MCIWNYPSELPEITKLKVGQLVGRQDARKVLFTAILSFRDFFPAKLAALFLAYN